MKKKIIYLALILFFISFVIVLINGRTASFSYDIKDLKDVSINYDKELIDCDIDMKKDYAYINVRPKKEGKAYFIFSYNQDGKNKETNYSIYVHKFKIVSLYSYFGRTRGDISFSISFYIVFIVSFLYLIKKYRNSIKDNLYSYKNARLLGLIIFLGILLIYNVFFFIYDLSFGYQKSISQLLDQINQDLYIFIMIVFPFVFLISLYVTFSNIKLLIKEGKNWKNMLGIILGGFLFIAAIGITFARDYHLIVDINRMIINNYFINLVIISVIYLECILIGTSILSLKAAKKVPKYDKDGIIILGCQINKDGTLTKLLKSRVDRAIEFSNMQKDNTGKNITFIPSGGKGSDEIISEGEAIKNYLLENGIKEKYILVDNKSTNTYENIKYSSNLINDKIKNPKLALSTTNYHVFRAGVIGRNLGLDIECIGSKTKQYYWINAFLREFIASLVSERKGHLKTLIYLSLLLLIFSIILYLSYIL